MIVALVLCLVAETPLTLDEAIRIAYIRHPSIQAQRAQVVAASGRQQQALSSFLPFLNGAFAYQPTTPNLVITPAFARSLLGSTFVPPPELWQLQNFWTMQVGVAWTFWDWGLSIYGYLGARKITESTEVGVRTAQRNVILSVTLAFLGAFNADEQLTVLEDALRTYNAHLAQTRSMRASGVRTGIDVATAESASASAAISLTRAKAAQQTARAQLLTALGEDTWHDWRLIVDPTVFDVQPSDERHSNDQPEALAESAFSGRTEIKQLVLQERGQESAVKSARGAYLPQLTLVAGPTWAGRNLTDLVGNFSITLAITYSGFSPLLVYGQMREARGNLEATRAQLRATRENIREEVVDAKANFASAKDALRLARVLVEAAARQRALAEGRYTTGLGNVIELYDALLTDVNARFQLLQSRLDLASARARLAFALGEPPY